MPTTSTGSRTDGRPVGVVELELPNLDNFQNAQIEVLVHPASRRAGIGRLLAQHAVQQVRANGRVRTTTAIGEDGPEIWNACWSLPRRRARTTESWLACGAGLAKIICAVVRVGDLARLVRRGLLRWTA